MWAKRLFYNACDIGDFDDRARVSQAQPVIDDGRKAHAAVPSGKRDMLTSSIRS